MNILRIVVWIVFSYTISFFLSLFTLIFLFNFSCKGAECLGVGVIAAIAAPTYSAFFAAFLAFPVYLILNYAIANHPKMFAFFIVAVILSVLFIFAH